MVVTFLVVLDNVTGQVNVARNIPANLNINKETKEALTRLNY